MQNQEIHIFTFNRIYLHSKHYFTSSNCIFMQLQGIVCIQLQGNDILVNCQGNKFIQRTYIYSQKVQSIEAIIFFHGIILISRNLNQFIQGNVSSFKENIFIQGSYIHSRKYIHLRNMYSFKFKAICSFKETIFIEHFYVRGREPFYDNYKLYNYC